jgi:mRNA interferase RelE/StbE
VPARPESPPWDLVLAAPGRRAIDRLPAKVAAAVLDFVLRPLSRHPHAGRPLCGDLVGLWSARVGAYRVLYEIDPVGRIVMVVHVDHRSDVYRPR